MAKVDDWKEGARSGKLSDVCPSCFFVGATVWDFQKFGKHRLILCTKCNKIHVDGDFAADVIPHKEAP